MKIIKTAKGIFDWKSKITSSVGFIPTMGGLHGGHLSLIKKSVNKCNKTSKLKRGMNAAARL